MPDPTAAESLADALAHPATARMSHAQMSEWSLEYLKFCGFEVVDIRHGEISDLAQALRDYLTYLKPLSGIHGQTMENTMAYATDRRLRSVAAKYLLEHQADG